MSKLVGITPPDASLQATREGLARYTFSHELWGIQSDVLCLQRKYSDALAAIEKAERYYPNTFAYRKLRLICLMGLGKIDDSVKLLQSIEERFPDLAAKELVHERNALKKAGLIK
jgi:hypothetical protein